MLYRMAACALLIVAGCHGALEDRARESSSNGSADAGVDSPDASSPSDPSDPVPDAGPTGTALACDDVVPNVGNGEHHPGEACIACHGAENEGPTFTIAGTLYTDAVGTAPVPGATIHIIDANGVDIPVISRANGNFYTTQQIAFPIKTHVGLCPNVRQMIGAVQQTGGDCNSAGCHGTTFRVNIPAQ